MPAINRGLRAAGYRRFVRDKWFLVCHPDLWSDAWWQRITAELEAPSGGRESRHARTVRIRLDSVAGGRDAFLKIYRPAPFTEKLKGLFRHSKALRALGMSILLQRDGFAVPVVIAAGERRHHGLPSHTFLITEAVAAVPLGEIATQITALPRQDRRERKRRLTELVGSAVGHLHRMGYVHGDMVVTNLLSDPQASVLYLIDHDRTRRPLPFRRRHQQDRNLIQLNRIALPGISHSDRLRVFVCYARELGWSRDAVRREARRLAAWTLARRQRLGTV